MTHNGNLQHLPQMKDTRHKRNTHRVRNQYKPHSKPSTLSVTTARTLRILRAHISKRQMKGTNLECEVNKPRFYEKNQYSLHWTLSSTQAESLHEQCTVTPAISLGDLLAQVNAGQSNIPHFIRNHHCRDGVRRHRECNACSRQGPVYLRVQLVIVIRDGYPYLAADGYPWKCIGSVKENCFIKNACSPRAAIHRINGTRITHCRS